MNETDWQEVFGVIGAFTLVTVVITVIIWQFGANWRAKAVLAREEEYRKLAEQSLEAQQQTERQLAGIQTRMESLERILKEVE
ncbi:MULTISPECIES: hypothetical protein [Streptomyces]|uniref:hypothetical protein n=1 Tax=Streptomyces TaxID=1883 RepID=UPI0006FA2037|nr:MULTISPECIES: hypothetical protein [Streptomyces]KQZ16547.1 hypothetical protein ASD51_31990 [Streptomyces sp. Root55]WUC32528.1 hypothetical protein OG927_34815 [Streptomyces clavifer]